MTNIIKNLKSKFENLTPVQKTIIDFMSLILAIAVGIGFVLLMEKLDLIYEVATFFICYFIFQACKTIFNLRVAYYKTLDKLNK